MRKILLVAVLLAALALPGLGSVQAQADCVYSFPTEFETATSGRIAQAFSTLRSAPGAATGTVVRAPAEFDVIDQLCAGGFSWVQIEYTSGTTAGGQSAVGRSGWALESQIYADSIYGAGRWLTSGDGAPPPPPPPPPSDSCDYSFPTQFGASGATSGEIGEAFSTLRSAPGAVGGTVILAPAEFDVLGQQCVGGFSWVEIEYTSGTTAGGQSAVGRTGWALESQIYADAIYGAGRWLVP